MLQIAYDHFEAGRFVDAERLLRSVLAADAGNPVATMLLALSLQALNRGGEAIPLFQRLTEAPDAGYEHWNNLGNCLREAGRHGEAEHALREALRRNDNDPSLLFNLGLNALDADDAIAAARWLDRALTQVPQDGEVRIYAAMAAYENSEWEKARQLLQNWRQWQATPAALAEAAWLMLRLDQIDTAEQILAVAQRAAPEHPRVLLRSAAIHERCNRLDQAEAISAALAQREDLDAGMLEDLALLRTGLASRAGDAATSRRLHEQLLQNDGKLARNSHLYFSYARICDQAGDAAGAMAALEKAHAIKTAQVQASVPRLFESGQTLSIARHRLTAAQYAAWPQDDSAPDAQSSPIFVVGFPRSGTTLLETMLDAHPQLACMDERAYLQDQIDFMHESGLRYPDDLGRLTPGQCAAMRAIYRESVSRHLRWSDGVQLVDKNPLNLLKLPLIRRLYPNARIILALRHPGDVLVSNYMQNFRSPVFVAMCASVETTARGYATAMGFWCDQHAVLGGNVFESRYETLVGDLPGQARRLVDFLGLPWDDALLAPHERAAARGYISTPSYSQVTQPVNMRAVERWRPYQQWLQPYKPLLQPYLDRWNYAW